MAEAVDPACRIWLVTFISDKQNARRTKGKKGIAFTYYPDADRACCIVTAPSDDLRDQPASSG